MIRNILKIILITLLVIASYAPSSFVLPKTESAQAAGNTYYVATNGNDNNPCSQSSPCRTVGEGISRLSAGDTLLVHGGNYFEVIDNRFMFIPSGTSWDNKIRIANYPGETVSVVAPGPNGHALYFATPDNGGISQGETYIEFDGINFDGSRGEVPICLCESQTHIRIENAEVIGGPGAGNCANICGGDYTELLNLKIHGGGNGPGCEPGTKCANYGFYTGGSNNIIDGNEIYDVSMQGIQIYNGVASNNIIRNNRIHDIVRSGDLNPGARFVGIIIASGSNNLVYNNIIYNIGRSDADKDSAGINVYGGSTTNTKIWNNTVYGIAKHGINMSNYSIPSNTDLRNNLVYGNGSSDFDPYGSYTESNNLFGVNPGFVNAGAGDFRLSSGNSPAVNGGLNFSEFTTDIIGATRIGAYDIGAYEFGGTVAPPPPPAPTGPPSSWYKFDEGSGTTATDSLGSVSGTLLNGPTRTTGRVNGGLSFDGVDDAVSVPGLFGNSQNLTLSGWANLTQGDTEGATIISLGDHAGIRLDDFEGKAAGFYFDGSNWNSTGITAHYAGTGWHHFAYVINNSSHTQTFYIDGVSRATTNYGNAISYSGLGSSIIIGRQGAGAGTYDFKGLLDEIRLDNRALNSSEVQALYAPPSASPSGTRVPTAASIIDNLGNTWTLSGSNVLRNGSATGGTGTQILWFQNNIYVNGGNNTWYLWYGAGYSGVGSNDPAATPGDLNLDHIVNSIDWSIMNSRWFTSDATADLNHDGIVNAIDYSILNANWFKTW